MKTGNWIAVTGIVAILTGVTGVAYGQSSTTIVTNGPVVVTTDTPNPMTAMSLTTVDFSILANQHYDYSAIREAQLFGYSNSEIARMSIVARLSGQSFRDILSALQRGETFPQLVDQYNLTPNQIYDITDEKANIADYLLAYNMTGAGAIRHQRVFMHVVEPYDTDYDMGSIPLIDRGILGNLEAAGDFTILLKCMKSTGLDTTLQGPGPYTIFAPTDAAFLKLSSADFSALTNDKVNLQSVLNYHIIPSSIGVGSLSTMTGLTTPATLQGGSLLVASSNGITTVNGANVSTQVQVARNGVIYPIDTVLTPPSQIGTTPAQPTAPAQP